jgi:hypothetical protein
MARQLSRSADQTATSTRPQLGAGGRAFAIVGDRDGFVTATYVGRAGTPFGIDAPGQGRGGVELGGYGALAFNRTVTLTASFSIRLMDNGQSHTGQAGLKGQFLTELGFRLLRGPHAAAASERKKAAPRGGHLRLKF